MLTPHSSPLYALGSKRETLPAPAPSVARRRQLRKSIEHAELARRASRRGTECPRDFRRPLPRRRPLANPAGLPTRKSARTHRRIHKRTHRRIHQRAHPQPHKRDRRRLARRIQTGQRLPTTVGNFEQWARGPHAPSRIGTDARHHGPSNHPGQTFPAASWTIRNPRRSAKAQKSRCRPRTQLRRRLCHQRHDRNTAEQPERHDRNTAE